MSDTALSLVGPARGIDPQRWPDVAAHVPSTWRTSLARRVLRGALNRLPLNVELAGSQRWGGGTPADPTIVISNPEAFFARVGRNGLIGFGESYGRRLARGRLRSVDVGPDDARR